MSETMNIEVQPRDETGKNANRRLARPARSPPSSTAAARRACRSRSTARPWSTLMKGHGGENPIFLLKLGDKERHAMIRNMQVDPLSRQVIHIDFQRVLMDQKVEASRCPSS